MDNEQQHTIQSQRIQSPKKQREQHKILIKRPNTVGGKLPLLNWKNGRTWRHISQTIFLLINLYIGITFYFWVRYYETREINAFADRSSGIEGWLPLAGLMNLKFSLITHQLPPIYVGSMFLLIVFLFVSLVFKRSFCSWLCPVGTVSEILWQLGKRVFKRNVTLPKWIDIPLRSLKYVLLAVIFYFLIPLSIMEIVGFLTSPYGIIIDVKMLDFFRAVGQTTLIVVTVLIISSLFIQNFWCRYLCPYGALMGFASLFSPFKIRRDPDACIDCNRCAQACPSRLPVDRLIHVRSIECTTCLSCVEICPAKDALQLAIKPNDIAANNGDDENIHARWKGKKVFGLAVIVFIYISIFAVIGYAKYLDRWDSPVPDKYYQQYINMAKKIPHPYV